MINKKLLFLLLFAIVTSNAIGQIFWNKNYSTYEYSPFFDSLCSNYPLVISCIQPYGRSETMQTDFIIVQKNNDWHIFNWAKPKVSNPDYNNMNVKDYMQANFLNCNNKISKLLTDSLLNWFIATKQSTIDSKQKKCADSIKSKLWDTDYFAIEIYYQQKKNKIAYESIAQVATNCKDADLEKLLTLKNILLKIKEIDTRKKQNYGTKCN